MRNYLNEQSGVASIEYAIIASLIGAGLVIVMPTLASALAAALCLGPCAASVG